MSIAAVEAGNQPDLSTICDHAAAYAAARSGVPLSVLKAISLTETGRKRGGALRPWPWTVNMEGKGVWFENETAARSYVRKNFDRGARSFDVGCFQINYKWHGSAFTSIRQMFAPRANALYAAKLLRRLFDELGSWGAAAGAYHSRTQKYARRYRKRFEELRARLMKHEGRAPPLRPGARKLAVPIMWASARPLLLAGGASGVLGSLVPLAGSSRGASLFSPRR